MDAKNTDLSRIIKLWQTFEYLQKTENPSIYNILEYVPDIEQTLLAISSEKRENFDLEVTIIDEEEGTDLFTIPGTCKTNTALKAHYKQLTIEEFKQIVLYDQKVSDWLITSSVFSIKRGSIVPFFENNIDDSWSLLKQRVGYTKTTFFEIDDHVASLEEEHVIWCYNTSCTGKTWLAIQLLDKCPGHKYAFNTSSTQLVDINLLYFILEYGNNCCLLIDDLQGDADLALEIVRYLSLHKRSLKNRNVFVVLVSWNGLRDDQRIKILLGRNNIYSFKTTPDRNKFLLKAKVANISENLLPVCGDNLCLLSKASMLSKVYTTYSTTEYQKLLFDDFVHTTDELQIKLTYICSVLGAYEYETPISFLEQYGTLEKSTITAAKFAKGSIYVGHKDICGFITKYIEKHYETNISQQEIIMEYIKSIDGTLKWKALLHIGHNKKSEVYYFGFIWNLLNDLMDSLRKAAIADPTFSKTPSSMCFVLLVANYFREVDDFKAVADSFANCFSIIDGHISIDFGSCRTTQDFCKIKSHMIEEDLVFNPNNCYLAGLQLDEFKMHSNWLLSLLVQVGPIMRYFGYVDLVTYAEQDLIDCQSADGSWYPNRVPWITSCALRGLSKVEIQTDKGKWIKKYTQQDEPIRKAINYLIDNMNPEGYWDAHTGGWNNIYETSAMCLDALHKFGIKCADIPSTRKALEFLKNHSSEWMDPGKEIDGASTACCLMDALGVEKTLLDYIQQLTERNITSLFSIPSEEELRDESCKAALIAYYVTELCWNIIERDIDQLMEEFLTDATEESDTVGFNNLIKEATVVEIKELKIFGGNTQIIDGQGTMIVNGSQSVHSIEKDFEAFLIDNKMTADEKNAVLPVLMELEKEAQENSEKIKKEGTSGWFEKVTKALSGVASVATIANAPWWVPLKTMITNFIASL